MRFLLLVCVVGLLGCSREEWPENGVYVSPKEVFPIHSEILELRNGRYQYWMQADVGPHEPIEMSGKYTRQGDRILISGNRKPPFDRLLVEDHGTPRLLRSDSEAMWTKEKTYVPYGTLSRVPYTFAEMTPARKFDEAKWEVLLRKLPMLDRPE